MLREEGAIKVALLNDSSNKIGLSLSLFAKGEKLFFFFGEADLERFLLNLLLEICYGVTEAAMLSDELLITFLQTLDVVKLHDTIASRFSPFSGLGTKESLHLGRKIDILGP